MTPAFLLSSYPLHHGRVSRLQSQEEESGMKVQGPCLNRHEGFMHLPSLSTGHQFQCSFPETDRGFNGDTTPHGIHLDTRQLDGF
jgi:hypothetical protein